MPDLQTNDSADETKFSFSHENTAIQMLISEWEQERNHAKIRRRLRRDDVNVEEKRIKKEITPDETFIPFRAIDQAVEQAKPNWVSYLVTSKRLVIFKDILDPGAPCEDLEIAFGNWMRYDDWNEPWFRGFDGALLHGGVALEVVFDQEKPLNCGVEYIRREDFIFGDRAKCIQSQERVIRVYYYMPWELEEKIRKEGWDPIETKKIILNRASKRNEAVRVFKVYKKVLGQVWVYWCGERNGSGFLKKPMPLRLGLYDWTQDYDSVLSANMQNQPPGTDPNSIDLPEEPVKDYPIFYLQAELIEDEKLLRTKGMAAKVLPTQEALTQIWTHIVNAVIRASSVYGSLENIPGEPATDQEEQPIVGDQLLQRKANYWYFPMPDPSILSIAQALLSNSQQSQGQINYSAMNRKDSRKTAAEMNASLQQQSQLNLVDVTPLAKTVREVYKLCWRIGQSQIWLLGTNPGSKLSGFPISRDRVLRLYQITPAGDVDFVQRMETKELIKQIFPIISQTPAANVFMIFMLKNFFPEQEKYWDQLLTGPNFQQLLAAALPVLQEAAKLPQVANDPQQSGVLNNLISQIAQAVGGPPKNGSTPVAGAPHNQNPQGGTGGNAPSGNPAGAAVQQNPQPVSPR